jgi:hypothetical protein
MAKKKMMKNTPPIIDRVPKHSQQPRSSPPKRRTDFSFFNRAPSSFPNPPIIIGMLFFFSIFSIHIPNLFQFYIVQLLLLFNLIVYYAVVLKFDCLIG